MKISLQKNIRKYLFPAIAIAICIGSLAWGSVQAIQKNNYKRQLESVYGKSFDELATTFNAMVTTLSKLRITNSHEQTVQLLNEVRSLSGKCSAVISQLPASYADFGPLQKMVVQIGDYALALTRTTSEETLLADHDRAQINTLYQAASTTALNLNELRENGEPLVAISGVDFYEGVDGGMSFKQEEGQELYPSLIYDGPFADSLASIEPRGLRETVYDEDAAGSRAQEFIGYPLSAAGTQEGRIPSFIFEGQSHYGEQISVLVTKQGGQVLSMSIDVPAKETMIPDKDLLDQLKKIGEDYIRDKGFGETRATYAQYYDGLAVINYAATQDGILLYNDLIILWIDVITGNIVGFDSTHYLMSHAVRSIPAAQITQEEAQENVSKLLVVDAAALAVIPKTPTREVLCYEFKCRADEEQYIIYINAVSGKEEQIFKIIDTGLGTLTL